MNRSSISVAICTFNRADSLARTLSSIVEAEKPADWELLVIDNKSTDHTAAVVARFAESLPIRYLFESSQGLSHARNHAVSHALANVLLFTDDDVQIHGHWLKAYEYAFSAFPNAAFFGGRILPDWNDGQPPRWLKSECLSLIDGVLVWYDRGSETRPYRVQEPLPFGASFAIRRSLISTVGGFRIDLGRTGSACGSAEETEFLLRAKAAGAEGVYVGKAICWHAVDPKRLTLSSLFRHGIAKGHAVRQMANGRREGSNSNAVAFIARGLYQLARGRGDRFRQCVINAGIQVGGRG
jgi:glycosyltransferase involved in cell wall biosynthesis